MCEIMPFFNASESATQIQRIARGIQARKRFAVMVDAKLLADTHAYYHKCATRIQKMYASMVCIPFHLYSRVRGYLVRLWVLNYAKRKTYIQRVSERVRVRNGDDVMYSGPSIATSCCSQQGHFRRRKEGNRLFVLIIVIPQKADEIARAEAEYKAALERHYMTGTKANPSVLKDTDKVDEAMKVIMKLFFIISSLDIHSHEWNRSDTNEIGQFLLECI